MGENNYLDMIKHASYSGSDISVYAIVSDIKLDKDFKDSNKLVADANTIQAKADRLQYEENAFNLDMGSGPLSPFGGDLSSFEYNGPSISQQAAATLAPVIARAKNIPFLTSNFIHLGTIQTISYSIYRGKEQAKGLGSPMGRGYTRGYITIAGSMIFTMLYTAVLSELFPAITEGMDAYGDRIDMLPPIDLLITFTNELGQASCMSIFGVEFLNEGQVMSVNDLITENSVNYVARDITRVRPIGDAASGKTPSYSVPTLANTQFKEAADRYKAVRKGQYF